MSSPQQADLELQKFFKAQARADKEYLREDKRDALNRKKYFKAYEAADKITEANVYKPAIRKEMRGTRELKTFEISTEATAAELEELYRLRHERYIEICSLLIAIWKDDGTAGGTWIEIPVTPKKKNVNDQTFHSIVISCPGKGFVEILIRESDNYIVAIRMYRTPAEKGTKEWCTFKENLPGRFKTKITKYGSGHTYIVDAKIGVGVLEEIFDFLSQLQENPKQETTDDGYKCLGTLYVLFGEAQRFKRIRAWVLSVVRDMLVKDCSSLFERGAFEVLVRDWSSLSKAGFGIITALLESRLFHAYKSVHRGTPGYDDSSNPYNTLAEAAKKLEDKQSKHKDAGLQLRFSGNSKFKLGPAAGNSVMYQFTDEFVLHSLVGEELSLRNHSVEECNHLLMRQAGYLGILYRAD